MKCANYNNMGWQVERDFAVSQAVEFRKTGNVFEFGTHHGFTTACLAEVAVHVWTLDLPDGGEGVDLDCKPGKDLGHFYKFHKLSNITQLEEDSMTFDPSDIPPCDLVVVDANHDYEHTKNDCNKALMMLRPGGCLLVHDAHLPSVAKYLKEHNHELIPETRYAKVL